MSVVAAQPAMLTEAQKVGSEYRTLRLHGVTDAHAKNRVAERFQDLPRPFVLTECAKAQIRMVMEQRPASRSALAAWRANLKANGFRPGMSAKEFREANPVGADASAAYLDANMDGIVEAVCGVVEAVP